MEALAHAARLAPPPPGPAPPRAPPAPRPPGPARTAALDRADGEAIAAWIENAAAGLGLEVEPVAAPHRQLEETLRLAGLSLVRVPGGGAARFFALAGGGRRVVLIAPDRTTRRVPAAALAGLLGAAVEAPHVPEID